MDRWLLAAATVGERPNFYELAYKRMIHARTPAQQGKDSTKDCMVTETYLAAAKELRDAGMTSRIVFLSSNINDYTGKQSKGKLNEDIAMEFASLDIEYAKTPSHARHLLGL
ncbi:MULTISPECIES: hypothetical protein [unclassified Caballeronia]|uniref:hypothetical protein n=1 Tax=unclassified Caballeronia TaxID=2646786 RepID=UPI002860B356|nr:MULTISPECIES: hypothetical protein [unclassified Caballeronia]MDR5776572.1 hypothetical protein [Caballeronia sp. LZ002]MDR5798848.1 hypothetical protein [Caballeronia sp. LZ001]MDR5852010.1 hypothetical protein [Caballeronia sp. LZ003]